MMKLLILNLLCSYLCVSHVLYITPTSTQPPRNNYTLTNAGVTCLVMTAGLELVIPYKGIDAKNHSLTMVIPSNPYVNGTCGPVTNILNVYFNDSWSLTFTFTNSSITKSTYQMDTIRLDLVKSSKWFPNISSSSVNSFHSIITTLPNGTNHAPLKSSYQCQGQENLALNENITMNVYDLQYRAFGNDNNTWFSNKNIQLCNSDTAPVPESDLVAAMAVGIALGVMIVLVVVLYFIVSKAKGREYGYI
ncbi:lysosome-associated membrane glycoprotein 1-like [Ruditapes philippinarum]|uniref:lysosome-associated membrane glycoprotein 1-like n=1 Tax=Ruditapes philippinarum TaxID=129788 RepID=UPI00295BCEA6|nr:lysosome-associated membrane glycoprotein 1-like [Ruditapes philippinarum]